MDFTTNLIVHLLILSSLPAAIWLFFMVLGFIIGALSDPFVGLEDEFKRLDEQNKKVGEKNEM